MQKGDAMAPLDLHRETVRPEWIDYNGHMNVAYYVLVFDHATDVFFDHLDLGEDYRRRTDCSTFVVEAHVTYENEVHDGDPLRVTTQLLGADDKRLHFFHHMYRGDTGVLVATNEIMSLHVDLGERRSAPFPAATLRRIRDLARAHARLPGPDRAGRVMALKPSRPPFASCS